MAKLFLSLLGGYEVVANDKSMLAFESDKVRALLAYLAIEYTVSHRRESLCGLFWPDRPERLARRSLSQSLYSLQAIIHNQSADPPFLIISQPEIRFNVNSSQWVDVNAFVSLITSAQRHSHADISKCNYCIEALQNAIQLYQGELLKGFSIGDSPAFEEWLLLKRERLNHMCICAIQQLIEIYQQNQRHEEAVAYARRWVEFDPLQEEAYYLLLKLLAYNGKRSEALAQFEQCRLVLKEELGVEPSAKLQKLYAEIRSGTNFAASKIRIDFPQIYSQKAPQREAPLISPESHKAVAVQRPTVPLLARENEIKRLYGFLNSALRGSGQVVFVTGESGRGKTALLNAFTCEAQERHESLIVVGGSCHAYKGTCEMYHPFSEILSLLAGDAEEARNGETPFASQSHRLNELFPSTVQALIQVGASLLDNLIPSGPLLKRITKMPGGNEWQRQLFPLSGEEGKTAKTAVYDHDTLVNGLSKVLERLAQVHPMLILLDNFQWADAGSLNVLVHLGRRIKSLPILLVVAYRPSEIAMQPTASKESPPRSLAMIVDEFKRQLGNVEVKLSREGDRPFVDAFLNLHPNRFDSQFREALDWKTGGNPLFVIELIRDMQERGELTQDAQGQWTAKSALDWDRLPQRVDAVIRERINHLPRELRTLLEVASVEGEVFTAEVLAHALSIDVREVIHQLSGALTHQHRLVRAEGVHHIKQEQGKSFRLCRYRFRQPLFQHYLYQELDQVQRALLHEAVGTAIEAIHGPEEQSLIPVAAQLSNHFRTAELAEKAITYWSMACGRMLNMIIPNEVAQLDPVEQS